MVRRLVFAAMAFAIAATAATAAGAQDLGIALNTLDPQPQACRLTFVADNATDTDITRLVLEAVLFTKAGRVAQFTLFDFAALPEGRQRVRQFDVAGLGCDDLGQVLLNGVSSCEGADSTACAAALKPHSTVEGVEVTG
ncbi:MAG: hypothetical protein U0934_03075 [Pseudotabrizicola sp.]|uniref:hypothetical protein n=1 Tax=Pseudotabrizicola sp. TaxID=2939647 RepID=UPI002725B099|nr:hypothetical protein [Pseudotabrizicola sp.]MDO8885179.1 hypothetical protein [Pseudotabrizicola sp.]MDP2081410.1 hypothetical protein [Pseudotabrizicola sp.]MDZ7572923.1 hypothetical protein [Pseudotabrizicola sp.]